MKNQKKKYISPAQEIMDDYYGAPIANDFMRVAAVLRAVANKLIPYEQEIIDNCWYEVPNPIREELYSVAAELESMVE
jgi:hypothetical protein